MVYFICGLDVEALRFCLWRSSGAVVFAWLRTAPVGSCFVCWGVGSLLVGSLPSFPARLAESRGSLNAASLRA